MTERIIHSGLLALHNLALVGCAAAPFYSRQLVLWRGQYGSKLHYELDKVVEDTLQGNVPYCITFMTTLWITGIGMPVNHWIFHGTFRGLHPVAQAALALKLLCVIGMMVIMYLIFTRLNPRLRELFESFSPDSDPDAKQLEEFFDKRARRKYLCEICLGFALGVLFFSAFIGWV